MSIYNWLKYNGWKSGYNSHYRGFSGLKTIVGVFLAIAIAWLNAILLFCL